MTAEPYPPLRPQTPRRRSRRSRAAWPLVAGIVVLSVLVVILVLALLSDGADGTATDPSPGATGSPGASPEPAESGSEAPTPTQTPAATPVPVLPADTVAEAQVDGLSVRAQPGIGAVRLGGLADGTLAFVAGGPTEADGHRWYLVAGLGLPPNSGCAAPLETDPFNCPIWFGWVAGTSAEGEAWLLPHALECPTEPFTADGLIIGRTSLERLACLGRRSITFRAWWPPIPEATETGAACAGQDQPSGWLLCQSTNQNAVTVSESEGFGGVGVRVSIDPGSGVTMPERGTWIELRVHHDDPAAQGCDDAALAVAQQDRPLEQYVLDCRAEMVVEAVQPVPGP